jgi:hypothetical protein
MAGIFPLSFLPYVYYSLLFVYMMIRQLKSEIVTYDNCVFVAFMS